MVLRPFLLATATTPWFFKSVAGLSLRPSVKLAQPLLICTNCTDVRVVHIGDDEWNVTVETDQRAYRMQVTQLQQSEDHVLTEGAVYQHQSDEEWEKCGNAKLIIDSSSVYGSFNDQDIMMLLSSNPSYQICTEDLVEFGDSKTPQHTLYSRDENDEDDSLVDQDHESASIRWPTQENVNQSLRLTKINKCFSTPRTARIGVIADSNYASQFKSSMDAYSHITNVVSKTSKLWEDNFNITLSLSELILSSNYTNGSAWDVPCNNAINSADSLSQRLEKLQNWRAATNRVGDGLALWALFTNCPSGDVLGLSIESSACRPSGATVIHHSVLDARVLAHEIGHIFGAVHDCNNNTCGTSSLCCPLSETVCDSNGTYIMSPGTDPYQNSFSNCSKANICYAIDQNVVNTTCLHQSDGHARLQPLSSLACSQILDPVIRDQCVRNTQCSDMMNTKRTFYCGDLAECSLSCFDPKRQVCAAMEIPLLDGAPCHLPLVGKVDVGISKGLCSHGHCVGESIPKFWPVWYCVILSGIMLICALLILGLARILCIRFRGRRPFQGKKRAPSTPPKGGKVNVNEWFSNVKQ